MKHKLKKLYNMKAPYITGEVNNKNVMFLKAKEKIRGCIGKGVL